MPSSQQAEQTAEQIAKVEELVSNMEAAKGVITAAAEDNAAYHTMMTNPDLLSEYVNDFFGPEGPFPVETAEDRLAAEVAASDSRFQPQQQQACSSVRASSDGHSDPGHSGLCWF